MNPMNFPRTAAGHAARMTQAAALAVLATACANTNTTNPANYAKDDAPMDPTTGGSPATMPTCGAIDDACDGRKAEGGLAKECYELASAAGATEEVCLARKTECMNACGGPDSGG